jgi:N-acetylglutamate synthase-like GNAT family acetyltransferase
MRPFELRAATIDDLPGVLALLREAGLPEDVEPHLATLVVAEADDGLVGAVGLEVPGPSAVLRSLVVVPEWRKAGLGTSLTERAIGEAQARSVGRLFLLTTDAAPFFERFGFQQAERDEAPAEIRATREFRELCPASARLMKLALAGSSAGR